MDPEREELLNDSIECTHKAISKFKKWLGEKNIQLHNNIISNQLLLILSDDDELDSTKLGLYFRLPVKSETFEYRITRNHKFILMVIKGFHFIYNRGILTQYIYHELKNPDRFLDQHEITYYGPLDGNITMTTWDYKEAFE